MSGLCICRVTVPSITKERRGACGGETDDGFFEGRLGKNGLNGRSFRNEINATCIFSFSFLVPRFSTASIAAHLNGKSNDDDDVIIESETRERMIAQVPAPRRTFSNAAARRWNIADDNFRPERF